MQPRTDSAHAGLVRYLHPMSPAKLYAPAPTPVPRYPPRLGLLFSDMSPCWPTLEINTIWSWTRPHSNIFLIQVQTISEIMCIVNVAFYFLIPHAA